MRPHKNLNAWKEGIVLSKMVYKSVLSLPSEEKYGLISQLKRASVSVPTNIAEGAARQTKKEFRQFLFISRGSLSELDTLLELSFEFGYIVQEEFKALIDQINKVTAMVNGLIKSITSSPLTS